MKKAYSKPTITLLTKDPTVTANEDGDTEAEALLKRWLEEGNAVKPLSKQQREAFAKTDAESEEGNTVTGDAT